MFEVGMKNKSFPIAILQGRLSPDAENRYQFFPVIGWQEEFRKAHNIGFEGIEWLIDTKKWKQNPIFNTKFHEAEILATKMQLPIVSVCADWFMDVCIWEDDPELHRSNIRSLFPSLKKTKNKLLLIPFLEKYSILKTDVQEKVIKVLKPLSLELENYGISIGFETELPASDLISFLGKFESNSFGVYYDIGNCTSYGFNCADDILLLSNRIKGIHLKDRKVGASTPMMLGTGDTDFNGIFRSLSKIDWYGTLVMQAWRGEDYIGDAQTQLEFIRSFFSKN